MFEPPRCPYRDCPAHRHPHPGFYRKRGAYRVKCRPHPVPRFDCLVCGHSFSRQTFRVDYRDHRPDLNPKLFSLISSGLGLRQTSRLLGLSLRCTELKYRKLGLHLRHVNENVRGPLPTGSKLQFDELETFEGRRNTRPLTLPVLIETKSRFVIWAESASIRPRGKMTPARKRAIAEDEETYGPRKDESRAAITATLRKGAEIAEGLETIELDTDEKSVYPGIARRLFGAALVHRCTNSKLARGTWNPLFPINHTEAMARDLLGRLRRDSWLASKCAKWLDVALHYFMSYRNYVRRRFNHSRRSPAQRLGFVDRRLRPTELLSWRQDWGPELSITITDA